MTQWEQIHRRLVLDLVAQVRRRLVEGGFSDQADLLAALGPDDVVAPASDPADLAVLRHLERALPVNRPAGAGMDALVGALSALAPHLRWTQTASYVRDPPSAAFLDRYAHATLAGPPDGRPSSRDVAGQAAVGVVMLGPAVEYPPHRHPAEEIYLPLGPAGWVHDHHRDYRTEPAGCLLHHTPWQAHGMLTGDQPLLALYVWTGDVTTASVFC
jgi:hypothetical protein